MIEIQYTKNNGLEVKGKPLTRGFYSYKYQDAGQCMYFFLNIINFYNGLNRRRQNVLWKQVVHAAQYDLMHFLEEALYYMNKVCMLKIGKNIHDTRERKV